MDTTLGYKNLSSPRSRVLTRPSLFPTHKKSSRSSLANRSIQSAQIICKTLYHTVESFGSQVPVQVTEALTFKERNTSCSVNISNDGWAWIVIGRRLFIWQAIGGRQPYGFMCKEVTLPPSDLAHKANLVSVFSSHGNQIISCIAVSPEGLIRYWPNVANESISIEVTAELQGQECESVHCIAPLGFIVSTTTANIMLVETNNIGGRHSLLCRPLTAPSGWFGGIGRRMSSLIFGSNTQTMETKPVKVLVNCDQNLVSIRQISGGNNFKIYVLAGSILQKWQLVSGEIEKLVYECDLHKLVADNFLQTVWTSVNEGEVITSFLDMQFCNSSPPNIIVLVSAVHSAVPNQVYYAFVVMNVDITVAPSRISSFHLLKTIDFSLLHNDQQPRTIHLLVTGQTAYLYNSQIIICIPVIGGYDEVDIIDLPETTIIGGSSVNQTPVFFSHNHGFISLAASDITPFDDFTINCTAPNNESITADSNENAQYGNNQVSTPTGSLASKDSSACLKAAFLHYVSKRVGQCRAMVNEMFPADVGVSSNVDSSLDLVTVKVSLDLINDIPARDPRWADVKASEGTSLNSAISLQILNQLQEKQQALDWYLSFLKDMGLWQRLGAVTWNDVIMATTHVFAEQAEKLIAAIVLRNIQSKYSTTIDIVIETVVQKKDIKSVGGLTAYDLFYRQVSIIHEALINLCEWCEDYVHNHSNVEEIAKTICTVNSILLEVLDEIGKFRHEKKGVFATSPNVISTFGCEILPWTVAPGNSGLRDSLKSQSELTLKYGIRSVGNVAMKQELLNYLVSFINVILDGWNTHISSIKHKSLKYESLLHRYETERLSLIQPLLDEGEYEQAAFLAEKYEDFTTLVQLYDKSGDSAKLEHYMDKFYNKGFRKFLFGYYIREKKMGKLLSYFRSNMKYQRELSLFLTDHPTLSWIYAIFCEDYNLAFNTLFILALQETELMRRKKSLLSLSKLTSFACENIDQQAMEKINAELDLIAHQEDLPENVLAAFGYDFETVRVFLPGELIRFYISEENTEATALDFAKALDLLQFVNDVEERNDLENEIWCKAVLRDDWPGDDFNVDNVIDYIHKFLFFRMIETEFNIGKDVTKIMPPLEKLFDAEELSTLTQNKTFQYLMRVGYEHYNQNSGSR